MSLTSLSAPLRHFAILRLERRSWEDGSRPVSRSELEKCSEVKEKLSARAKIEVSPDLD